MPRVGSRDVRVEERVDVGGSDIHARAEGGRGFLQNVQWLSGRDGALISSGLENGFRASKEISKGAGGAIAVEDGFVADDYHLHVPVVSVCPLRDFADLAFCLAESRLGDEHPEHESQAVRCGGSSHFLQARAVGAVETDRRESLGGDGGDVGGDGGRGLAAASGGVG